MDLLKIMQAAGIGCGERCKCAETFTRSLSDIQKEMFGHMIVRGAEIRLNAIEGMKRDQERQGSSFMDFAQTVAGGDDDVRPNLLDAIFRALSRGREELGDAAPYDGELGDEIESKLATISEDERGHIERRVRQVIAVKADNNPARVVVEVHDFGLTIGVLKGNAETVGTEATEPPSEAAA